MELSLILFVDPSEVASCGCENVFSVYFFLKLGIWRACGGFSVSEDVLGPDPRPHSKIRTEP